MMKYNTGGQLEKHVKKLINKAQWQFWRILLLFHICKHVEESHQIVAV